MSEPKQRVVVCAAIRNKAGVIVAGARHYDSVMRMQFVEVVNGVAKKKPEWYSCEQGFIDQYGRYMDRHEAWEVAKAANQIKHWNGHNEGTLCSEDLY